MRILAIVVLLGVLLSGCAKKGTAGEVARVEFETSMGSFVVETDPEHAKLTVANFLQYVDDHFYDGLIFHRIVDDVPGCGIGVVQGGGMTPDGKPRQTRAAIPLEATPEEPNVQWSLSMARTNVPNSGTSQFFINTADNSDSLKNTNAGKDGYAVFGHVVSGFDNITAMTQVPHSTATAAKCDWVPATPIVMTSVHRI